MKINLSVLGLVIVLILMSCSKEKTALNKLEGSWVINTLIDEDSIMVLTEVDTMQIWTFDLCEEYKDSCTGLFTYFDGSTSPFLHNMASDAGEFTIYHTAGTQWPKVYDVFTVEWRDTTIIDTIVYEIVILTNKELAIKHTDLDGNVINTTFDKQ